MFGLIKAVENYDETKNTKFSTYAIAYTDTEITPPYTGVTSSTDNNLIISLVVMTVSTLLVLPTRKILFD